MTLEEKIKEYERLIENAENKLAKVDSSSGVPYYSAPMRATLMSAVSAWEDAISLLRELKAYREKPKRRIDEMSEEELAKTISEMLYQYGSYGIANYLLSPAEEKEVEKSCENCRFYDSTATDTIQVVAHECIDCRNDNHWQPKEEKK